MRSIRGRVNAYRRDISWWLHLNWPEMPERKDKVLARLAWWLNV